MKIELAALTIDLVSDKLNNALLEMGHYGGTIDLPTARHRISVAVAALDLLSEIMSPEVVPECDCSEMGLEYTCCAKEEWEAEHAAELASDQGVEQDKEYKSAYDKACEESDKRAAAWVNGRMLGECCDRGCLEEGFQRCHAGHVGD